MKTEVRAYAQVTGQIVPGTKSNRSTPEDAIRDITALRKRFPTHGYVLKLLVVKADDEEMIVLRKLAPEHNVTLDSDGSERHGA